jgi:hypothetical protein
MSVKSNLLIKKYSLSKNSNLYFVPRKSLLLLKSDVGVVILKLPSYYFYIKHINFFSLLFLQKFFYFSFIRHFFNLYNRLSLLYFLRIKIRGLGYRIRKVANGLYYFFFNYTNMFYFHVPDNVLLQ